MKTKSLKVIIILLAAIVVSVFNWLKSYSLQRFSITLLIVLVIFYVIGSIVQGVVNRIVAQTLAKEEAQLAELQALEVANSKEPKKTPQDKKNSKVEDND
ncbi:MAG: hypothetical protein H7X94_03210 [Vallitaleaceae bacterium]|nr:hypothetical protein [Vallitaleaceae bacterium]